MLVGDDEIAIILFLQSQAGLHAPDIVANVKPARGSVARQYPLARVHADFIRYGDRRIEQTGTIMQDLASRMANWAVKVQYEDLPPAVVHEVKRRVLDSLGCAFGSYRAEPCEIARRVAGRLSGNPGSTILGTRHIAPPDWAAFANGCLVRYLDYNDTYLSKEPAHPSDNIPAAMAVAE